METKELCIKEQREGNLTLVHFKYLYVAMLKNNIPLCLFIKNPGREFKCVTWK